MAPRRRRMERTRSNTTDTPKKKETFDVLKTQHKRLEEKPESSHLSNYSHEQLEKHIESPKKAIESFKAKYSELQSHIEIVRGEINKIPQDLPREELIKQQLTIIENSALNDLMSSYKKTLENEKIFLEREENAIKGYKRKIDEFQKKIFDDSVSKFLFFFRVYGVNTHLEMEYPKRYTVLSVSHYYDKINSFSKNTSPHDIKKKNVYMSRFEKLHNSDSMKEFMKIGEINKAKIRISNWNKLEEVFNHHYTIFNNVDFNDDIAVKNAYGETLRAYHQNREHLSALKILTDTYLAHLKKQKREGSGQLETDREKNALTLPTDEGTSQIETSILTNQPLASHYHGENVNKEKILEKSKEAWESTKSQAAELQNAQKLLQENANVEYSQEKLLELCESIKEEYKKSMITFFKSGSIYEYQDLASFYDFVEKNITNRLSNSLDELEKKNQEALSLLEEEVKKLESLHSQKQSERSDQPQVAMEMSSLADTPQNDLETSFKDTNMTPERKDIILSYLSSLFKESHPRSFDDETERDTFFKKNIEEAKQVATFIEKSHFYYKTQGDVIRFAIHLKHKHGFPLHQAGIDEKFNIVRYDRSKGGSSLVSRLEIDRGGKILKDGRVQRVYLIGFQDASQASSSDAEAKPLALLAMQSTETGYPKYGAGTPLPTGGVVDVVTAQYTRHDQPNLYKATLAVETLQETQEQKEVDLSTLELFETETIMNPHTKACLYDITTFTGKVKDKPPQALPEKPKQDKAYQETTGACMVDLDELISAVKQELDKLRGIRWTRHAMRLIKEQIQKQVSPSDEGQQTDGKRRWDHFDTSTSMNMFARYLVLVYREELGLASSK